ncbi:inositol monophosphatase family protein [Micromonospora sp. NPDC048830]|uniref:inositol monophosphatase family protein n=1 Tax=Micromonospora sp. NPDC048830 TaxID=3364257 RepID=UPI00371DBC0B
MDLSAELRLASDIALRAGAVLVEHFDAGTLNTRSKSRRQDVVTDADIAAEKVLVDALAAAYPEDAILAEESGNRDGGSGRRWCIDPLDGTANFAAGIPHWAVALSLLIGDRPVLAVTFDPSRDELFTALYDGPAQLDGWKIGIAATSAVQDALVALNLPYAARTDPRIARRMHSSRGLRETGSMALDLAWVATGRLQLAAHEHNGKLWDYAGGELLVTRAGGAVEPLAGFPGLVLAGGRELVASFHESDEWPPLDQPNPHHPNDRRYYR